MTLSLTQLVRQGTVSLARMALAGELEPKHLWVALKGAAKYREALSKGDFTSTHELNIRKGACSTCALVHNEPSAVNDVDRCYCGPPFRETDDTCGCLIGIRVHGEFIPGGKLSVASERCPSAKW